MSHLQFQSKRFILRHAWLNLWDERITTGRINQVAILLIFSITGTRSATGSYTGGRDRATNANVCIWNEFRNAQSLIVTQSGGSCSLSWCCSVTLVFVFTRVMLVTTWMTLQRSTTPVWWGLHPNMKITCSFTMRVRVRLQKLPIPRALTFTTQVETPSDPVTRSATSAESD